MTGGPGSEAWLTATGSARAIACPASLIDSGPPRRSFRAVGATAGSVVHSALQLWLQSEGWMRSDPLAALRAGLSEAEICRKTRLMALPAGGRALQSLRSIAAHLSEILVAEGATVESLSLEVPLVSEADRLWGVPDLVVRAARTLIVDFKTGIETAEASEAAHRQLMFYAHLLRSETGRAADELIVVSPTGAYRVRCNAGEVERYMARLGSLREARRRRAAPEQRLCAHCPLRMHCEPHWEAVDEWESRDAVRGRLVALTAAMNGVRTLVLRRAGAEVLISVPKTVRMPRLRVGDEVRLARVQMDPATERWRAGRTTVISYAP